MFSEICIYLVIAVFVVFIGLLIFVWGGIHNKNKFIKQNRIQRGEEIYYVIPWPEADMESWVEYMKECERMGPVHFPLSYFDEWNNYLEKQEELREPEADSQED